MNEVPALPGLLHDLNNIFQTLVDAADLLSEDPRWKPVSAAILRSVERGRHVALSLQANRGPALAFQTILDNSIAFIEDAMLVTRGPAIQFKCRVDQAVGEPIELPGTWDWERVLINLFLNSMRAMPRGGVIEVDARESNSEIQIVVRDSGCGIPPDLLGRLFEPGVSTNSSGGLGLHGLGLHVVKSIVEQYGGSVRATNRADGPGAEFGITLPVAPRTRPAYA
jgi:signal transduction histidine kinase